MILTAKDDAETFEQDFRLRFQSGIVQGVAGVFFTKFDNARLAASTVIGWLMVQMPPDVSKRWWSMAVDRFSRLRDAFARGRAAAKR